jgi:thiosulfate:glutathione sulfurtransferase
LSNAAKLIPLGQVSRAFSLSSPDFKKEYGFDKPAKDTSITFYCRSGKRSTDACGHVEKLGYDNVKNYVGSWLDWTA